MLNTPGPSASLGSGQSHPCAPSENGPRGLQRAHMRLRQYLAPPPPTEADEGGPGRLLWSNCWSPAAGDVIGVHEADAKRRQKYERGNTWVAPKGATPMFTDFPVFLVPPTSPSSRLWRSDRLPQEGDQNTEYSWLSPFYGLVKALFIRIFLHIFWIWKVS